MTIPTKRITVGAVTLVTVVVLWIGVRALTTHKLANLQIEKVSLRPGSSASVRTLSTPVPAHIPETPVSERAQQVLRGAQRAQRDSTLDVERIIGAVDQLEQLDADKRARLRTILEQGQRMAAQIAAIQSLSNRSDMWKRWELQLSMRLKRVLENADQQVIAESLAFETAGGPES